MTPHSLYGKVFEITNFSRCLCIVFFYWEVCIHFPGEGRVFLLVKFSQGDKFLWGGKFPGGEFFNRNFALEN